MKIVKYALPSVTSTNTTISNNIAVGTTILPVVSSTGLAANDFLLIEEQGAELNEIVKISSVDSATQITLTSGVQIAHLSSTKITKILYNQYKITRSDALAGTYTTLVTANLDYAESHGQIVYVDESVTGSDQMYYKVYYVNSHTPSEVLQATLNNQDNFSYITVSQFRNETGLSTSIIPDGDVYDALNSGVEFIRDEIIRTQTSYGTSSPDSTYIIDLNNYYMADTNADRVLNKDDLVVFEYDTQKEMRIYVPHKITKIIPNPLTVFFDEEMPRNSRQLVFMVPVTFKSNDNIRSTLKTVNKLLAVNYVLTNVAGDKVKSAVLSWTAGGTTVNKDPNIVAQIVENNTVKAKKLISEILQGLYVSPTKLRTKISSLNQSYPDNRIRFMTQGGNTYQR